MYSSLVRNSFVFISLLTNVASAAEITSQGYSYYSNDVSLNDCKRLAQLDARKNAMSKAGLERGSFYDKEICTDSNGVSTCELIQQNQSYYDGGFIKSETEVSFSTSELGTINQKCEYAANFEIEKFTSKHDPDFLLSADTDRGIYRDQDEVRISGVTNQMANVYLFWVDQQNDTLEVIVPNEYEPQIKSQGTFSIPTKEGSKKWGLYAEIPANSTEERLTEFFLVLATKSELALINSEDISNFYQRLNELGRENWRKIDLGYAIIKEQ